MPEVADGGLWRASSSADCLAAGGEMGALARSIDWSRTPIGPVESWSPALRMIVQVVLANREIGFHRDGRPDYERLQQFTCPVWLRPSVE